MKPQEKLPIISNNINDINFRPQTVNPVSENENSKNLTSKNAGNEVRNAVESFEKGLIDPNIFR